MWHTVLEIVQRVGGDPGFAGLRGSPADVAPRRPGRVAVLETAGRRAASAQALGQLEDLVDALRRDGVVVTDRSTDPAVEALERAIADATETSWRLSAWESRWGLEALAEEYPATLGPSLAGELARGRSLTLTDYRQALAARAVAEQRLAELDPECEALLTLSAPGEAPLIVPAGVGEYPTGDVTFACAASYLRAPAINVPVLRVDGLPLGLQVIGRSNEDSRIVGTASWLEGFAVRR